MERQYYTFGSFRIDAQARILTRDEQRIAIPPKTIDVLLVLLERAGDVIGKDEILQLVWPDTFVADNNLAKHIFLLRRTLGENEDGVSYIETIPKRGYRLRGCVEPHCDVAGVQKQHGAEQRLFQKPRIVGSIPVSAIGAAAILLIALTSAGLLVRARSVDAGPWRSVAVLPFVASAEVDAQLGSAFTQEIAARLHTIQNLRVICPIAGMNIEQTRQRFTPDTILSGRLVRRGGQLHAAAQLQNAHDGTVLWAEDTTGIEPVDMQTAVVQIASSIAARLSGRLLPSERASVERGGSTNLQAYKAFLEGRAEVLHSSGGAAGAPDRAAVHFAAAVRLDPGFADAWAGLAHARRDMYTEGDSNRSDLVAALDNARRAVSIDPQNLMGRDALVRVYQATGQQEEMLREAKALLDANPRNPDVEATAAYAYRFGGMLDRAIPMYERYVQSYPDDEDAWYQLVMACLFAREHARGIRYVQPRIAMQRLLFPGFVLYANSGDMTRGVAIARQAIASDTRNGTAYFAPLVLDSAGLHSEAQSAWSAGAIRLQARLERAENERTRTFLAMILARLGRHEAAREHLERVREMHPNDPWAESFASETYALLHDRAAALDSLRRSIASGFLGLQYVDYYIEPPNGWAEFRNDPEFVQMRDGLARRISALRQRY